MTHKFNTIKIIYFSATLWYFGALLGLCKMQLQLKLSGGEKKIWSPWQDTQISLKSPETMPAQTKPNECYPNGGTKSTEAQSNAHILSGRGVGASCLFWESIHPLTPSRCDIASKNRFIIFTRFSPRPQKLEMGSTYLGPTADRRKFCGNSNLAALS